VLFRSVDLVVYNSGTDQANPDFDWKIDYEVAQVNAMGFIAIANAALQYFQKRKAGHLVGISSFVAIRGNGRAPVYSASKAFMAAYMRGLRQKLLGTQIAVTDIRPGYVETELVKSRKQAFWMVSPAVAAEAIYQAIQERQTVSYIPKRWWGPAQVLQMTPNFLYDQIYLKKFKEALRG
jgi:short-subunit dehydrogenase